LELCGSELSDGIRLDGERYTLISKELFCGHIGAISAGIILAFVTVIISGLSAKAGIGEIWAEFSGFC